jgi:hypothetical protein
LCAIGENVVIRVWLVIATSRNVIIPKIPLVRKLKLLTDDVTAARLMNKGTKFPP